MSGLRVALFASEYPPHLYGGLGTHVHATTAAMARNGVRIDLFVPDQEGYEAPPPGLTLHRVPAGPAGSPAEHWIRYCEHAVSAALALGARFDVVHCHDWMTVLAGVRLRRALGTPLVFSVHLPQTATPNLAMENLGLVWADCVLVNSGAVHAELTGRGLPMQCVRVIPNGVDLDVFVPGAAPPAERYLLFVGRLVAQKGADVLLRAFATLLPRVPGLRLVCAGDGDQALFLQRLARHLGVRARVSFPGWQRGPALVRLYQRAEVVAVPSLYEPFGIVALEAMACGRPVVASRVGGLAEVVQDGDTGYLVQPGDHLQLAQRVAALCLDPDRARRIGEAGRRRASGFSWDRVAEEGERAYRLAADAGVRGPRVDPSSLARDLISSLDPELAAVAAGLAPAETGTPG